MEKRVSKLSITADDLERRENLAKRQNRNAKNRLRQQHEQFQENHDFIKSEINHEIKKLQEDLKGIREIGNYDANLRNSQHEIKEHQNLNNINIGIKQKRKKKLTLFQKKSKSNSRRKLNRDEREKDAKFYPNFKNSSQIISVEKTTAGNDLLQSLTDEKKVKNTQTRDLYTHDTSHETRKHHGEHETKLYGIEDGLSVHEKGLRHEKQISENRKMSDKHEPLPQITQNATEASAKSSKLDVQEARSQARKRLLHENDDDSSTQGEQEVTNNDDIESYMYVPPDGRKRTVYLLPPLEELLPEARKARYLRMPKRLMNYEDDPERELSVDEIFSKSV